MAGVIQAVLAAIQLIAPYLNDASAIAKVIQAIEQLIPVVEDFYADVAPMIKNIIATLKQNGATTADQMKALADLDAKVDAEFEAAVAAANAEDNAG